MRGAECHKVYAGGFRQFRQRISSRVLTKPGHKAHYGA